MKNKLGIALFISVFLLSQGCSHIIRLESSPSDSVLISIKSNYSQLGYNFKSSLKDSFEYRKFLIPMNETMEKNLNYYMETKFSKLNKNSDSNSNDFFIEYSLDSFQISENYNADFLRIAAASAIKLEENHKVADLDVNSIIILTVKVFKKDALIGEKRLVINSDNSGDVDSKESMFFRGEKIYQSAINKTVSKSIVFVDKYLTELGL